ncbi:ead/Ea22-like family protein [Escherichia coli]|uniref:ead/Ea22-like family protein n=1 Tax=Escherichia coli TaxID=562 RepID=UPI0035B187CB
MKNNTQPALKERIEKALEDFTKGRASMHVPPLDTDVDVVLAECSDRLSELKARCAALAAENAGLNKFIVQSCYVFDGEQGELSDAYICAIDGRMPQTQVTDAFWDEVKTEARKEGAYFVANRMLAAWDAGFIDDTAKNAADIARMILTSTEFMANAPEGDFDRSFADGVLEDIAAQIRKGDAQ